ncbi:bifunctional DNA primase/polymerase [Sorangium sp. So ce233]|uniref:bifunctional DNA primase/polymerase n=1 Tax=Sorangium sp. So ce233 TaxID=3133290 RepID=UPI003F63BB19
MTLAEPAALSAPARRRASLPEGAGLEVVNGLTVEEAALCYLRQGFRALVVHGMGNGRCMCSRGARCQSPAKHPVAGGWTDGLQLGSEDKIRSWYRRLPHANIALLMGGEATADQHVIALDVDGDQGQASLDRLIAACGPVPETLTLRSGRDGPGYHLIFCLPREVAAEIGSVNGLLQGVDVKGPGGYVVVAPSVHRSRRRYQVVKGVPIAALPALHAAYLRNARAQLRKLDEDRRDLKPEDFARIGTAEDTPLVRAFAAAGWLGRQAKPGVFMVRCPWHVEHTGGGDGRDSSAVVFAASQLSPIGAFHCMHAHCAGRRLGDVLRALPAAARDLIPERPRAAPEPTLPRVLVSKEEARSRLLRAYREPGDGLSVVIAGCGVGKTEAAVTVAIERADRAHLAPEPRLRAPLHSRTVFVVPTLKLARQLAVRIDRDYVLAEQHEGPLAARNDDGSWACHYHDAAAAFAASRQSVRWSLCEGRGVSPCDRKDGCRAYNAPGPPDEARIAIFTFARLKVAAALAGKTGLLILDEPPPMLEHHALSGTWFGETERSLRYFEVEYVRALRPAVDALRRWLEAAPLGEPSPLDHIVGRDAIEEAKRVFEGSGAKLRWSAMRTQEISACRRSKAFAARIGAVGRGLSALCDAMHVPQDGARVCVEERKGHRVLVLSLPNMPLYEALRREGATVIVDANAGISLEVYERAVGYRPKVTEVHVADGCAVHRTQLRVRTTRTAFLSQDRLDVALLVRRLREVVSWVRQDPMTRRIAIVSFKLVEVALRSALGDDVGTAWGDLGQDEAALDEVRRLLAPELGKLPARPDFGHYGALRGLDEWRELDALVTLGDPWWLLTDVQRDARYIGLPDWERRYEALCAAELEQAHGRLRTVHRTRPARLLHVGNVVPGGWRDAQVWEPVGGRPKAERRDDADELAALVESVGGVKAVARLLGTSPGALRRYVGGERAIPAKALRKLADACAGWIWHDPGIRNGVDRRS